MQSLLLCAYVLFNLVSHTSNLFSFVQHQSAASNQPHDLAPSLWNSWPKWSPVAVNSWPKYLWFYLYLHLWIICDYLWLWMSCDYYLWILKFDTQQTTKLCRVPNIWHSANVPWPFPLCDVLFRRVSFSALGKVFAECPIENTRQRYYLLVL